MSPDIFVSPSDHWGKRGPLLDKDDLDLEGGIVVYGETALRFTVVSKNYGNQFFTLKNFLFFGPLLFVLY